MDRCAPRTGTAAPLVALRGHRGGEPGAQRGAPGSHTAVLGRTPLADAALRQRLCDALGVEALGLVDDLSLPVIDDISGIGSYAEHLHQVRGRLVQSDGKRRAMSLGPAHQFIFRLADAVDGNDLKAFVLEPLVDLLKMRKLRIAGPSSGEEERQEYHLPL